MDKNFTLQIRNWLDTDPAERDLEAGALMLLKLTSNRIQYANVMRAPQKYADWIEAQLSKHYDFRVLELTHDQVRELERKAEDIISALPGDTAAAADKPEDPAAADSQETSFRGRRPDHDSLPDNIKALWTENFDILRRMRECHVTLRMMTLTDHPCQDSERYPFLKEIIQLDKRLHANWKAYDLYNANISAGGATDAEDDRDDQDVVKRTE